MPVNGFSVGRDVSLTMIVNGAPLTITGITEFSADPVFTEIKTKGLDGTPKFGVIPDGWKGSIKLDRSDRTFDSYTAALEAGYFAGQNQLAGTALETIQEADGSISQWRYTGLVLKPEKAGDWGGDKKVEQSFSFNAAKKIQVS